MVGKTKQLRRKRLLFTGIVQGVGFRPSVYRCAARLGLTGYVQNLRSAVKAEIQGDLAQVEDFLPRLHQLLPREARIDTLNEESITPNSAESAFCIMPSAESPYTFPPIPPDLALCADCSAEVLDPTNRRYLYPFITCTRCGPRYSIVRRTPFDRERSAMDVFPQCDDCRREYENPDDRRFHSQTNSCAVCGPHLHLSTISGQPVIGDPLVQTIRLLEQGAIVAIQGLGGFHIAVDPRHEATVMRLRAAKDREAKPFALMVRDLTEAEGLCRFSAADREAFLAAQAPIVIADKQVDIPRYLETVSDTGTLGLMRAYSPLHLLLFAHPEAQPSYRRLIMTSGNRRLEPICTEPAAAHERLAGIVDYILSHNREIVMRTDDSVLRTDWQGTGCLIRRSRGFVPELIRVSEPMVPRQLALGGDLKNAPAVNRNQEVYLSPYIGDLANAAGHAAFAEQIEAVLALYSMEPDRLLYDAHPGYVSRDWALHHPGVKTKIPVQHHHAHILSVMAEHGLSESLGLAFDGTGYGLDGSIWGGEFLAADRGTFTRLGCFRPFPLPGGDAAIRVPRRILIALLMHGLGDPAKVAECLPPSEFAGEGVDALVMESVAKGINTVSCSSLGRIFDAAAAALGLVDRLVYEAEGPIKLESAAQAVLRHNGSTPDHALLEDLIPFHVVPAAAPGIHTPDNYQPRFILDPVPLLEHLCRRRTGNTAELARLTHQAVTHAAVRGAGMMRELTGRFRICLAGGVLQNMLIRRLLIPELEAAGFVVYTNRAVPPGDGGIALGQLYLSKTANPLIVFEGENSCV